MYGAPQMYKCYVLTNQDLENVQTLNNDGFGERMAEAMVCESYFGNIYSGGSSKVTPGCGNCPCCMLRKFGKYRK